MTWNLKKKVYALFAEHFQAGSLLFEHRDVQLQLRETPATLANFNFNFLMDSKQKMNCNVWRMKTRVVVNARLHRCMSAINDEHWTLHVSRCLTPHVCFSRLSRDVDCVAARAEYEFFRSGANGYFLQVSNVSITTSDANCKAPVPPLVSGNHYFAP
ncbi:unnamed protein product [Cylicocyclus nassatus]|uniref:Uncharacterized protein n=1 Tax=Cylicocyclus nassatus TaxID=53992 RepID=A0AA36GR68_CYLNA|nr:unnamed protein product [Cylicocyclus nassatus]